MQKEPSLYKKQVLVGKGICLLAVGSLLYFWWTDPWMSKGPGMILGAILLFLGFGITLVYHSKEKFFQEAIRHSFLVFSLDPDMLRTMEKENRMVALGQTKSFVMISLDGVFMLGRFFRFKDFQQIDGIDWQNAEKRANKPGILKIRCLHRSSMDPSIQHTDAQQRKELYILIPPAYNQPALQAVYQLRDTYVYR